MLDQVDGGNEKQPIAVRLIPSVPPEGFPDPTGWMVDRRHPGGVTTTGYNIINTFTDRIAVAGVLAGFSIAVAALIVAVVGSTPTIAYGLHFKDLSSMFVGLAAVLFIASMELFLNAKENNYWDLPAAYKNTLEEALKKHNLRLPYSNMNEALKASEQYGRYSYNLAIILLFIGMFFVLYPVSVLAAIVVPIGGFSLEIVQAVRWGSFRQSKKGDSGPSSPTHGSG